MKYPGGTFPHKKYNCIYYILLLIHLDKVIYKRTIVCLFMVVDLSHLWYHGTYIVHKYIYFSWLFGSVHKFSSTTVGIIIIYARTHYNPLNHTWIKILNWNSRVNIGYPVTMVTIVGCWGPTFDRQSQLILSQAVKKCHVTEWLHIHAG